ncbi:MAG: P-II family nitrogen regulator [Cytophagales bacterium]|nr:P-II family nitrogen regulator [Cytophagales bacterium]
MQEIRAIIRPSKLDTLRNALRSLPNFPGLSLAKVEGFTAPALIKKQSDAEALTDYSPKLMVYIVADESVCPAIIQTITQYCRTGQTGDGLIWTTPISSLTKIKNGEQISS